MERHHHAHCGQHTVEVLGDVLRSRALEPSGRDFSDYGAIALRRSVLADIEDGAVWGIEALFRRLARQRKLRAFLAPERAYDCGSPELEGHLASLPVGS